MQALRFTLDVNSTADLPLYPLKGLPSVSLQLNDTGTCQVCHTLPLSTVTGHNTYTCLAIARACHLRARLCSLPQDARFLPVQRKRLRHGNWRRSLKGRKRGWVEPNQQLSRLSQSGPGILTICQSKHRGSKRLLYRLNAMADVRDPEAGPDLHEWDSVSDAGARNGFLHDYHRHCTERLPVEAHQECMAKMVHDLAGRTGISLRQYLYFCWDRRSRGVSLAGFASVLGARFFPHTILNRRKAVQRSPTQQTKKLCRLGSHAQ